MNIGEPVKSRRKHTFVIPSKDGRLCRPYKKAPIREPRGILGYQSLKNLLDPGFHRGDDFLRVHQH
jgi:hypothetical protein